MLTSGKPAWLKKRIPSSQHVHRVKKRLRELKLHTVCESASCPNIHECFSKPTATFMILGNICTRSCGFCGVGKGAPLPVDPDEPQRVAETVKEMNLKHVVITSVTRDDLDDGGASQFEKTISEVRLRTKTTIEILTPDISPNAGLRPDIYNHNLETVPRLYPRVRPSADYHRSLDLLRQIKKQNKNIKTKSGIMLGFGEKRAEILRLMENLLAIGCDILTIGQYLQPSKSQLPVAEYVDPERFKEYGEIGKSMGFLHVASGPFVRSSFNAEEIFNQGPGMVN